MYKQFAFVLFLIVSILAIASSPTVAQQPSAIPNRGKIGELPADLQRRDPRFTPSFKDGKTAAPVKGIWRSRGYGYVIDLTADKPDVYIETDTLCWHSELGTSRHFFDSPDVAAYRLQGANKAIFTGTPGGTYYEYDRLAELPAACTAKVPVTPQAVFDAFWTAMKDRYAFFRLRVVDWSARRDKYRPKALAAKNDEELYESLTGAMSGFGDGHLTLTATVNGKKKRFRELKPSEQSLLQAIAAQKNAHTISDVWDGWVKSDEDRIAQELMNGEAHRALQGHMMWGIVSKNVGYIDVNLMSDYGGGTTEKDAELVATELDKALDAMTGADSMIVDVTQNRGGDDRIARVIASRFTDKQRLAYTKRVPVATPQPLYLYPAGPRQFLKPVYMMTSELTHSAAEVFTLAMRVLPNVVQVGQNTGGALSDMLATPLPNDWFLTLSNEIYLDPAGHLYESKGIPAQKRIEIFQPNDLASGHVAAVHKVLELTQEQK